MHRFFRLSITAALAGLAPLAAATPAQGLVHHPRVTASAHGGTSSLGWASSNWSGYAITGGPFTAITGKWAVPSVLPSRKGTYSSNWIGIDGFNNSSLIQTGTESDYYQGSAHYDAWWEILPASETVIPSIAVHPGDVFTASITESGGQWVISITDSTTGQGFSIKQSYSGPLTSAEWIEEAPTVGGRIAPLAHYSTTNFDPGTANGVNPGLVPADGGTMVQNGATVSTPSNPDRDTDGFAIAYGSVQPAAPGS